MITRRNEKGSIIAFSTVLALVLVLLGVGFVFLLMYMGGQRETKNAADAGTLNIGKQALDQITVDLSGSPNQQCYFDVTNDADDGSSNNDGKVTLRRINRVWAKAMLIGINADAAQQEGQAGSGGSNADQAFQGAKAISDSLSQKLCTPSNLHGFFSDYSTANSVRMINPQVQTKVLASSNWQTSLMDRTPITSTPRESNITVNPHMPNGYTLSPSFTTSQTRTPAVASGNGLTFLKGYTGMSVAGNDIWQVPFQYDERPRLVSSTLFKESTNSANPLNWNNAVPNAFSAEGEAVDPNKSGEKAISWVLTNPRQNFQMSMPHSFLKIHLDEMKTHWYFFPTGYPPIEFGSTHSYGYEVSSQSGTPMPQGGVLCSLVEPGSVDEIGLDVVGRPLDQIIFGPPGGNNTLIENQMTNRINEMISKVGKSYSTSDMHSILMNPLTIGELITGGANEQDFYMFSTDGVNVQVAPKNLAQVQAMWLGQMINNTPDGDEKKIVDDASIIAPILFEPTATPDPFCVVDFTLGWGTWEKDLYWQPGTGYNGCLGQVRVTRWTNIYSLGVATPIF